MQCKDDRLNASGYIMQITQLKPCLLNKFHAFLTPIAPRRKYPPLALSWELFPKFLDQSSAFQDFRHAELALKIRQPCLNSRKQLNLFT